jgi:hypothetical protein
LIVFLDTGPLGGIVNPNPRSPHVKQIQIWAQQMEQAGHALIVPAIVDYEQRREHERRNAVNSIAALDAFISKMPNRYLELTDSALKRAAKIWADLRRRGLPTADVRSLDCDIVLASQVLDLNLPAGSFTVATSNVSDLSRVIGCQEWRTITP